MRGERGDDGADRDEADSPAHRLRARIAGEEDRASSAAAARLARARADFYAAYLDAWRGAAAAADDGGPGGDDLDADASSKRLKRFAHFNGHFGAARRDGQWACDDAALRDELKADLKRLVADPWEAFYARNAHRPFSSKHQDKYTRWAPSLVDAALDRCFDPGRATAPRRPSTHWAGAAAQAALPA
ncbi:hypothetical protein JL721_4321 [Aureococcus anophagefferens]|nr:hypothetical protein JL721_4321 [Aureococcus anophagefferens]